MDCCHGLKKRPRSLVLGQQPQVRRAAASIELSPSEMAEFENLPGVEFAVENWTLGMGTTHALGIINGVVDEQLYSLAPWSLPILALSSSDTSSDRIEALRAGVDDYLARPCDPEELMLRLDRMPGGRTERKRQ